MELETLLRGGSASSSSSSSSASSSSSREKRKRGMAWTEDLHKRFLDAVDACGGPQGAVPCDILKVMNVEGLTRHNVASHLQKYRAQLKKRNEIVQVQVSPLPPFGGVVREPVSGVCCCPANMSNIPAFLVPSPIPPHGFPVSQVAVRSEPISVMHDEIQGQQCLQADINKNDLMCSTENAYCMKQKNKKRKNEDGEGSSSVQLNTKKTRFLWTPNKHKKFVFAVKSLGCERAVPTKIMEVMGVEGLTRHIVASHLQKYRIQVRSGNQKEQAQDKLYDLHDCAPTLQQISPEDLAFIDDDLPTRAMPHVEEPLPPLVDDIIGSVYEGLDEFPWENSQDMMGLAANNPKNVQEEDADVVDQFFNFNGYLVDQKIKELEDFLFDDEACQL